MPANPFVVHVARLRRTNGSRCHEVRVGPYDPEDTLAPRRPGQVAVAPAAEATCDVTLESYPGGVMATGTTRAPWQGVCVRCAVAVGGELVATFKERFVEGAPGPERLGVAAAPGGGRTGGTGPGGVEGRAGRPRLRVVQSAADDEVDDEAYPLDDDRVDLGPLVREVLEVELPLAPLCRADCQGLCPQCGADRNEAGAACSCLAPMDPRWASLDVLRTGPTGTD